MKVKNHQAMNPFAVADLKKRWAAHRMKVLSENVANSNVYNYKSRDIKSFNLRQSGSKIQRSDPRHLVGSRSSKLRADEFQVSSAFQGVNKNTVQVSKEMAKLDKTGSQYDAAIKIQKKIQEWLSQVLK